MYHLPLIYSVLYNTDNAVVLCAIFVSTESSELLFSSNKTFVIAASRNALTLVINISFTNPQSIQDKMRKINFHTNSWIWLPWIFRTLNIFRR